MTTAGVPWPQFSMNSFLSVVRDSPTSEGAFYGPYIRLLYHFFSVDGPFEISLQFNAGNEVVAVFTVKLDERPVLFIQDFKRQEADRQMRERFSDFHGDVVTQILPGISAFGTRLSFYQYDKATSSLTPPAIAADLNIMNDAAPQSRWDCDILDVAGAAHFFWEERIRNGAASKARPGFYVVLCTSVLILEAERSNITINSTDRLSPLLINPSFFSHLQDLTVMRHAVAGARWFLSAPVWDDYVLGMFTNITDLERSIRNGAKRQHSILLVLRGPGFETQESGGSESVDASILSFVPAGHTQAVVHTIAERAADLIKESC
ncbi:hypothetical protein ARMGADRAFT_1038842 [Armillaria gallica]|uniref:Uncharacterized protein n=1 Tax=Armillaria gallica TaxID=47427 RepID=A0A2H3D422_ARMGA|nr:hypothetical protein ARMGADRAFT_1038842 [Armillaria gallica]